MKKHRITAILLVTVLAIFAVVACACIDKPTSPELEGLTLPELADNQMAIVIKNGEKDFSTFVVTFGEGTADFSTVEDVLAHLLAQGVITLDWSDSAYGKTLNSIGSIQPDASKNQFVTYLTTVESDFGTWAGVTTYTVGDVKLVSSGLGISSMTAEPGAVILFELATY